MTYLPCQGGGGGASVAQNDLGAVGANIRCCTKTKAPPCVTFRRVAISVRGPGRSPGLPFACCVGSLLSVGRCGRCSCWCRCRVRGAQWLVCRGCAVRAPPLPRRLGQVAGRRECGHRFVRCAGHLLDIACAAPDLCFRKGKNRWSAGYWPHGWRAGTRSRAVGGEAPRGARRTHLRRTWRRPSRRGSCPAPPTAA